MARSVDEIYDSIIAEKNTMANLNVYEPNIDDAQTLLTDLKSTSKVARWRLVFWCVAVAAHYVEVLFDLLVIALEAIAAKARYGTLPWYVTIAKEFQLGDALVLVDSEWKYSPVIEANRIVKLAAAKEAIGIVNVKVAKITGGVTQALSGAEKLAFETYIKRSGQPVLTRM